MEKISLDSLLYAVNVHELGSLSAAAQAVGISQPALSNSIARLEENLGQKIFERSPRGVKLTDFGENIFPQIEDVVHTHTQLLKKAQGWGKTTSSELRVGISPVISEKLVGALLKQMRAQSGDKNQPQLVLREANLTDLQEALSADELDLLLVPSVGPLKGYEHRIVGSEPLIVVGEKFTQPGAVPIESLGEQELIMLPNTCGLTAYTCDVLEQNHVENRSYRGEAANYRVLEEWAKLGLGQAVIPESKLLSVDTPHRYLEEDGVQVEIFFEAVWNGVSAQAPQILNLVQELEKNL